MLEIDSHESALVYVVDVLVCNWVEVFEEVVADECQNPCQLPGFVRPESPPEVSRQPLRFLYSGFLADAECLCSRTVCESVSF